MVGLLVLAAVLLGLPGPTRARERMAADPGAVRWFRDARFGMFLHWGVYSLHGRGEWVMNNEGIPISEYEKLPGRFNPTGFQAREWVSMAKQAGMRYITITSKHHDGFAMYDSRLTKYDIVDATPFRRDVLKELADECRRQGLKLFFYYSQLDWHHPDFFPRGGTGRRAGRPDQGEWARYKQFYFGQVRELCTRYGKIGGLWFDGWWDRPNADWGHDELYAMIHRLQPQALVGNNHHHAPFPGEDFQMFEQDLPGENSAGFNRAGVSDLPLETCRTMNNSWGYNAGDTRHRPAPDLIRYLIQAAGRDANLLLNTGPLPDGRIQPEHRERYLAMGSWLQERGEAIYGTRGGPFRPSRWGVSTRRDRTIFLHILNWPAGGRLRLTGLRAGIREALPLRSVTPIPVTQTEDDVELALPDSLRDPVDAIVRLELEQSAEALPWIAGTR
ncbi:MAG: alpha-L-fucosidase [Armatimonadetes bacterium]|nr:alpha-L-fucosidase [Armatimonadota bacterium]